MSTFAMPRGLNEAASLPSDDSDASEPLPDFDDPRVSRVMNDIERDMAHLDENNPKHMAHMMRKLKEIMPQGTIPKEMDVAIKRLESGEDPEKIEADMGDVFGAKEDGEDDGGMGAGGSQPYSKDSGLYDY